MSPFRHHLRALAWFAFIAMAALALLPTVSHALAHAGGGYAEVCTTLGVKYVPLADGDEPAGDVHHYEPCPFCGSAFGALLPPPAAPAVMSLPLQDRVRPPLFLHGPRTLHAWASAQPRAPPALS